jgi:rhodanese-related sulfurtransferase
MHHLSAVELAEWLAASDPSPGACHLSGSRQEPMLLDVREPWEYALCHIAGSVLMPMRTLADPTQ